MKKKVLMWVAVALVVVATVLGINSLCSRHQKTQEPSEIELITNKIDSIYIVRDSIINRIDTVYKQIDDVKKEYEKDVDRITSNNLNEDYIFFTDYINSNRARLDSINNSR